MPDDAHLLCARSDGFSRLLPPPPLGAAACGSICRRSLTPAFAAAPLRTPWDPHRQKLVLYHKPPPCRPGQPQARRTADTTHRTADGGRVRVTVRTCNATRQPDSQFASAWHLSIYTLSDLTPQSSQGWVQGGCTKVCASERDSAHTCEVAGGHVTCGSD